MTNRAHPRLIKSAFLAGITIASVASAQSQSEGIQLSDRLDSNCPTHQSKSYPESSKTKSQRLLFTDSQSLDYFDWLARFLDEEQLSNSEQVGMDSDPDGDGQSNFFEFLTGLNPTDSTSVFQIGFIGDSRDYLRIRPISDNASYYVQCSEDLRTWLDMDSQLLARNDAEITVDLRSMPEELFYRARIISGISTKTFALVGPGDFLMGSPEGEKGRSSNEEQHIVTISREYYIARTEVTWSQWNAVRDQAGTKGYFDIDRGRNGLYGDPSGTHPVTQISWWDAIKWCNLRSELEGRTPVYYTSNDYKAVDTLRNGTSPPFVNWNADGYRLPTEAEWEYACRATTSTAFCTGDLLYPRSTPVDPNLDLTGWYRGNSDTTHVTNQIEQIASGIFDTNTQKVGQKQSNHWGLFDMHGNVWEMCWDWYIESYEGNTTDPTGPTSGSIRVYRGGSFFDEAKSCRSAKRYGGIPTQKGAYFGFRLALTSTQQVHTSRSTSAF